MQNLLLHELENSKNKTLRLKIIVVSCLINIENTPTHNISYGINLQKSAMHELIKFCKNLNRKLNDQIREIYPTKHFYYSFSHASEKSLLDRKDAFKSATFLVVWSPRVICSRAIAAYMDRGLFLQQRRGEPTISIGERDGWRSEDEAIKYRASSHDRSSNSSSQTSTPTLSIGSIAR